VQSAIHRRHHRGGQHGEPRCRSHPLRRRADETVDVERCHFRRLRACHSRWQNRSRGPLPETHPFRTHRARKRPRDREAAAARGTFSHHDRWNCHSVSSTPTMQW